MVHAIADCDDLARGLVPEHGGEGGVGVPVQGVQLRVADAAREVAHEGVTGPDLVVVVDLLDEQGLAHFGKDDRA